MDFVISPKNKAKLTTLEAAVLLQGDLVVWQRHFKENKFSGRRHFTELLDASLQFQQLVHLIKKIKTPRMLLGETITDVKKLHKMHFSSFSSVTFLETEVSSSRPRAFISEKHYYALHNREVVLKG